MDKITKPVLLRKLLHIMTGIIPVIYIFLPRFPMALGLGIFGALAVIIDFLRLEIKPLTRFVKKYLGPMMWEREMYNLSAATHYAVAAFLSVYLFEKWIAIAALLFLSFGDTAAHLIGVRWGITHFDTEKTIEGSAACLVICLGISMLLPKPEFIILVGGAIIASLVELFPMGIDDNLTLPIISGVAMEIMKNQLSGLL